MEQKYKRKRFDKGTFTKRKGEKDKYNVIYDQKKEKTFTIHVSFLKATLLREDISTAKIRNGIGPQRLLTWIA